MAGEGEIQGDDKQSIIPRRLEGLNDIAGKESWGGNAGPNRSAVHAYYDGSFHFWTGSHPKVADIHNSVIFGIKHPDYGASLKLALAGKPFPPSLIDEVIVQSSDVRFNKECSLAALEHNAWEIQEYARKGGDLNLLPSTPFRPKDQKPERI